METFRQQSSADVHASAVSVYMNHVYMWMTVGLGLTAFIAWQTASSQAALQFIFSNTFVLIGLIIANWALS